MHLSPLFPLSTMDYFMIAACIGMICLCAAMIRAMFANRKKDSDRNGQGVA